MAGTIETIYEEVIDVINDESCFIKVLEKIYEKELNERSVIDRNTTEALRKLGVSIENLPQKCQKLLLEGVTSEKATATNTPNGDDIEFQNIRRLSEQMEEEYKTLKLQHKNVELQSKINKNAKDIAQLRQDLEQAKKSLRCQKPNPETVKEEIRNMKLKVTSYEENYEKAKAKYTKLCIPEELHPKQTQALISQLATLRTEELQLKQRTDDIMYTRQVRHKLTKLRL